MYQLIQQLSLQHLVARQIPVLVASCTLAELFYKFHSFTLECMAFLATWYVCDVLIEKGMSFLKK